MNNASINYKEKYLIAEELERLRSRIYSLRLALPSRETCLLSNGVLFAKHLLGRLALASQPGLYCLYTISLHT